MRRLRLFMLAAAALMMSLTATDAGAWCNPDPLECGDVITTNLHSGNTHDDINTYNCTGGTTFNGNAHVYRVYPSVNSPMWITLEWTAGPTQYYDLRLFVLSSCNRNACIANDPHEIYFPTVTPGDDYWIIVDGRGNSADNQSYTLSIYCDDNPLSAELTSFDASRSGNAVDLSWSVASETNNENFEIERQSSQSDSWSLIGRVAGRGTASGPASYSFRDDAADSRIAYRYRLSSAEFDGSRQELGTVDVEAVTQSEVVSEFKLVGNYPNPFNPTTSVVFEVAEASDIRLDVFSVDGRLVQTLVSGMMEAGRHEVSFDASTEGAGVYFARLSGVSGSQMMKMILLK